MHSLYFKFIWLYVESLILVTIPYSTITCTYHWVNPFTPSPRVNKLNVVVPFESVDEYLVCDYSNESYWAVIACGTVCFYQCCKMKFKIFSSILNLALLGVKGLKRDSQWAITLKNFNAHPVTNLFLYQVLLWGSRDNINTVQIKEACLGLWFACILYGRQRSSVKLYLLKI